MAKNLLFGSTRTLMLLGILVAGGCDDKTPADKAKELPRVTVSHPTIRDVTDTADYNGRLEAYKTLDVVSKVQGYVTKVDFAEGQYVKSGGTLFEIDKAPFETQLKQTEAQARALDAQRVAAEAERDRNQILVNKNAVSKQEFDKSVANAESLKEQVAATNAEADRIRLDIDYATIESTLSGKIGKTNVVVGTLVSTGATLATIVCSEPIYVEFYVDERAVQLYQKATADKSGNKDLRDKNLTFSFALDTDKDYPHEGRLVFVDNKFAPGTGTILVRGEAANKDKSLIPGSRVRVRLPLGEKYKATLVPDEAINTEQTKKYLLVVGADKIVTRVDVELGSLRDDGMRVVKSPTLAPNTQVITEGMERARLNYPVEPILETAAEVAQAGK